MKDIFQQLKQTSKSDIADKSWLAKNKLELLSYVRLHPMIKGASRPFFRLNLFRTVPAIAFLSVFLIVGAGTVSVAAQGSLPGDFLYSWKVGVENIESAFVVGTQNRAQFEVDRTTKRLEEVTKLAVNKNTDTKVTQEAHQRLQAQIQVTTEKIEVVASENKEKALETTLEFSATLAAHKSVLDKLQPKVDDEVQPQIQDVIDTITKNSSEVSEKLTTLSDQNREDSIAKKSQPTIEQEILIKLETAKKKLNETFDEAATLDESSLVRVEAELKLNAAQEALLNAELDISLQGYDSAISEIQTGSKLTAETSAFLDASEKAGEEVNTILDATSEPTVSVSTSPTAQPSALPSPKSSATPLPTASPVTDLSE